MSADLRPPPSRLPLEGIRVLDLTMVWAGPSGTRLLADMGAEVIKVESARSWDMLRSLHFLGGHTERWWDKSPYFNHNNRNKYGCTIDLQTEHGRELALQLAAISDVVFENYRADVIGKLGLDYDRLREAKPDIILVSMPSHGKSGPES
ncbi:MAG: CoA transferase, partial [Dehalococcoidia bacterium]